VLHAAHFTDDHFRTTNAHLEAFAGNTIEFIRSESPLLIDGMGIPDIDVDVRRRHVVVVAEGPAAADDLKALKPFIKEYQPVLVGVGMGADVLRKAGYRPALIVGDPDVMSVEVLRSGAQVVLPADAVISPPGVELPWPIGPRVVRYCGCVVLAEVQSGFWTRT
jgi:uncharacterized membrane-anchored protein